MIENKLYLVIKSSLNKTFYLMDDKTYYSEEFEKAGVFNSKEKSLMRDMITCKDINKLKLYLKKKVTFVVDFNEYFKYLVKRI